MTSKYSWGKRSQTHIDTLHPDLVRVLNRALSYGVIDLTVIDGARSTKRQRRYFAEGRSHIDGVTRFSKHQIGGNTGRELAAAFDVVPLIPNVGIDWKNSFAFHLAAGVILTAAAEEGVHLRWGGDWDGDFVNKDQNFHDLPHFELTTRKST